MKNTFKSYNSNVKKLESVTDQINYIYNFINYEFNSLTTTNVNILKEIDSLKKNNEKIVSKLQIVSNDVKKIEAVV